VDELKQLAEGLGVTEEDLQFGDLLVESNINIWQENVLYLLSTLKHGSHGQLAEALGVTPGTISKWKKRDYLPEKTHLSKLCEVFELRSTDLLKEPLFLSPMPADIVGRRQWLYEQIQSLDGSTLQLLFPALERLLRSP
jgi:transcriptional regulator with XRE-family HTH domain